MGTMVGLPSPGGSGKDLQLSFGKNMAVQVEVKAPHLLTERRPQSGIQLTQPHTDTDRAYMLEKVQGCFVNIAREIAKRELLLTMTPEPEEVKKQIVATVNTDSVCFLRYETNDTWARDHGAIIMIDTGNPSLFDFTFNGWGLKFASELGNLITGQTVKAGVLKDQYTDCLDLVLGGGSIESGGMGTLPTTTECLLSPHRNRKLNQVEMGEYLKSTFHLQKILRLDHDYLAGDDTGSRIDTLARLCSTDTIAYVKRNNTEDEHYGVLYAVEEQLKTFRTLAGEPYRLLTLPMADKVEEDGERLSVTYINFLVMNDTILYPIYQQSDSDRKAGEVSQQASPRHQVIDIDCWALIKQHDSLHCVTMQYPSGVIQ